MNVKYRPPLNDKDECEFLEANYLTCLKEKVAKDNVDKMNCKVENILWFQTECSNRYSLYENKDTLRQIFVQEKLKEVVGESPLLLGRK